MSAPPVPTAYASDAAFAALGQKLIDLIAAETGAHPTPGRSGPGAWTPVVIVAPVIIINECCGHGSSGGSAA